MKHLLAAELLRLRSRRIYLAVLLLVLIPCIALTSSTVAQMAPPTDDERTAAQENFEVAHSEWVAHHEQWEKSCQEQGGTVDACRTPEPTLEEYFPYRSDFWQTAEPVLTIITIALAALVFSFGASFVAGDRTNNQWRTWLLFVPSRSRSLAAKILVIATASLVTAALIIGLALLIMTILAGAWDVPVDNISQALAMAVRGVLYCVATAIAGVGAGAIAGRTAWVLSAASGYIITAALMHTVFYGRTHFPRADLIYQAFAWLRGGQIYSAWGSDGIPVQSTISMAQGGAVWLAVMLVMVALGFVVHSRRDVS